MANPFDVFDQPAQERAPTRVRVYPNGDPRNEGGEPSGGAGRFAAPALAANPFDVFDAPQIDFNRPVEAVRADIAKLEGPARDVALRAWADDFVSKESKQGGVGRTADNVVRTLARGSFVGPVLDEITALTQAGQNAIGLGGAPYDEAVAYQRARDRQVDEQNPLLSLAGKLVGGVAGGIGAARQAGVTAGGVLAGGPLAALAPAASMGGKIIQGAGVGGVYGAAAGAGNAEGNVVDRLPDAITGAQVGAALGGVLPPAVAGVSKAAGLVSDAVSPTFARWGQNLRNIMPEAAEQRPTSAGAVGLPPQPQRPITGAEAASEQAIANQLSRANVSTTDVRQRLAQARMAGDPFETPVGLVDADNSLARLAGSVVRQQPEAGNRGRAFIYGRQTGETPVDGMPQGTGIPTRASMTPEVRGQQMGQFERVRETLRDAMGIPRQSANRTFEAIEASLEQQSRPAYRQAYDAARGIDMNPVVRPLVAEWRARALDQVEPALGRRLNAAAQVVERALTPGRTSSFERLNAAKISIDEMIGQAMRSTDRRSPALAAQLTAIKNELVDAMDAVPNVGAMYNQARAIYGGHRQMQEALELGRAAFREGSEITAAQYAALAPGQREVFRIGLFDSFEQNIGGKKRTADITQIFESPRVQEILQAVIPNAGRAPQLGRALQTEKGFIATRNEVLGNSKTAERLADDEAFNRMTGMIENLRSTRSVTDAAFKATQAALDKLIGFRPDTAAQIARKLFTADPRELDELLLRLESRMGRNRAAQFARFMEENHNRLMQGAATTTASQQQQGRRRTPPPSPPFDPNAPPMPRPPSRPPNG